MRSISTLFLVFLSTAIFCVQNCQADELSDSKKAEALDVEGLEFEWVADGSIGYRSKEPVYKTSWGHDCFRRLYVPEEIGDKPIRGVIAWDAERHYFPQIKGFGPRSTIQTQMWREFAAKHQLGMLELASRPLNVEETVDEIQKILEDMGRIYQRDECQYACFTYGGTSGTGQDTLQLAAHGPVQSRMIAGFPCSARLARGDADDRRGRYGELGNEIPLLLLEAGRENFRGWGVLENYQPAAKLVSEGRPLTFAVRISAKHPDFRDDLDSTNLEHQQVAHSMRLAMIWLDEVLDTRLPNTNPPVDRPYELKSIPTEASWLGYCTVDPAEGLGIEIDRGESHTALARYGHIFQECEIAPNAEFPGGSERATSWFPGARSAKAWKEYNETGKIEN